MFLSAVTRARIVLTTAGNTLVTPFSAFVVWDGLRIVCNRWRCAVNANAGPGQGARNASIRLGGCGIGLLEAEERAGRFLIGTPRILILLAYSNLASVLFCFVLFTHLSC